MQQTNAAQVGGVGGRLVFRSQIGKDFPILKLVYGDLRYIIADILTSHWAQSDAVS